MKFSIIVPVYNVEKYIKECIDSILDQSFQDFEIICIDDGSTDESLKILHTYQNPKIKIISQKNSGLSSARNKGLTNANGEYIWFIDSDDKISANSLEKINELINKNVIDIVFFNAKNFYENQSLEEKGWCSYKRSSNGINTAIDFFNNESKNNSFFVSACMYIFKRSKYGNLSFIEGILHEDNPFIIQLLFEDQDATVLTIQENFFLRRIRENSIMTSKKSVKNFDGYNVTIEKLLNYSYKKNINNKYLFKFIADLGVSNCNVALTLQKPFIKKYFRQQIINYSKIPNISLKQKIIFLLPEIILITKLLRKILGKK